MLAFQGRATAPKVDLRRRVFEIAAELRFFLVKISSTMPRPGVWDGTQPPLAPARRVVENMIFFKY